MELLRIGSYRHRMFIFAGANKPFTYVCITCVCVDCLHALTNCLLLEELNEIDIRLTPFLAAIYF